MANLRCIAVLAAVPFLLAAAVNRDLPGKPCGLDVRDGRIFMTNRYPQAGWQRAEVELSLRSDTGPIHLQKGKISRQKDLLKLERKSGAWKWESSFSVRDRLILINSVFVNTSAKRQLLEAGVSLLPDFKVKSSRFWNGFGKVYAADRFRYRQGCMTTEGQKRYYYCEFPFPAAAVSAGDSGIFAGHEIFAPVSWSSCSFDPGKNKLHFSQRFVADPGQTVKFSFVIGSVRPVFGLAEAVVQHYYDTFPQEWQVVRGQDNPYVWGNHAQYGTWKIKPDPERSRRHHYKLDWAYCPYKRSGDIRMRKEFWDYKPFSPFSSYRSGKYGGVQAPFPATSYEELVKIRRERFLEYGQKYGWMFYNSCVGHWCEYQLALKHYPDAIIRKKGKPVAYNRWTTAYDREYNVFPYHTSFGKVMYEDMTYVAKELQLPGFALDCGSGGFDYRGPAVEKPVPGRAWDKDGIFIDNSVAINAMVDHIRSINPKEPLTSFCNGTLKGDYMMFERSLVHPDTKRMMPLGKWWIGPRPGCVHAHGYLFHDTVPNWKGLSTEEFLKMLSRLADYTMLNQFKYGLTPNYNTMVGVPEHYYILPESFELMRAGWQAEIPLELSAGLYAPYKARYGKAENSYIYLGNSSARTSSGTLRIDNRVLAPRTHQRQIFVLKKRSKARTENKLSGSFTAFDVVLPSRVPVLWESVCGVIGGGEEMTVKASAEKSLEKEVFRVEFVKTHPFTGKFKFRQRRGFSAPALRLNGRPVKAEQSLNIRRGDKLEILYRSENFCLSSREITTFPYTSKNGEVSLKVGFPGNDQAVRNVARRFNDYFTYCRRNGLVAGDGLCYLVSDPGQGEKGMIRLQLAPGKAFAARKKNGGILLSAPDAKALDRLTTEFFYQMDKRFDHVPPLRHVEGMDPGEFNANGKRLPLRRFFD